MTKKINSVEELIQSLTDTRNSLEDQKSYASSGEAMVAHVETLLSMFVGTDGCDCGASDAEHNSKREIVAQLYLADATRMMLNIAADNATDWDRQGVIAMVTALTFVHLFTRDDIILSALKSDMGVSAMIVDAAEEMTMTGLSDSVKIGRMRITPVDTKKIVADIRQKITLMRHTDKGAAH